MKWRILCLAICLTALPFVTQAQDETGEILIGQAYVNTVEITVDMSAENPVMLHIVGELGDPCTTLGAMEQTIADNVIEALLTTERPMDLMCAAVLEPFEADLPLDVTDLAAGDYTLILNGVEATFTLGERFVAQAAPLPCPTASATEALYESAEVCFLYPADYLIIDNESLVLIDQVYENADGQRVTMLVLLAYEVDVNLMDVIDDLQDEFGDVDIQVTSIAGETSLISQNPNVPQGNLQAYIIHNGLLYVFDIQPNSDEFPDSSAAANTLWEMVKSTLVFRD